MKIIETLFKLSKEAKTPEVAEAYMIAILHVENYILERKEKEKKEQIEREESALALAAAMVELYENRTNNTDK